MKKKTKDEFKIVFKLVWVVVIVMVAGFTCVAYWQDYRISGIMGDRSMSLTGIENKEYVLVDMQVSDEISSKLRELYYGEYPDESAFCLTERDGVITKMRKAKIIQQSNRLVSFKCSYLKREISGHTHTYKGKFFCQPSRLDLMGKVNVIEALVCNPHANEIKVVFYRALVEIE